MSNKQLGIYLKDHLAGSAAALELLAELGQVEALEDWATHLRSEIVADREQLEAIMAKADIDKSAGRQAAGWTTAKLAELKTRFDDCTGGALQQLELIEVLALGIEGKRALWTALQAVAEDQPALRGVDYPRLLGRAEEQRRILEGQRLRLAAKALSSS